MASKARVVADLFDENGFLLDFDLWDRDIALAIAGQLKLGELEEDHWAVIDFLREHYLAQGPLPWPSHICRTLKLDADCIRQLFGGPIEAWKVAGLPDPGEEARTAMANEGKD
jgi:TusE/DsrC/DsvC family sulfur relay protein